MADIELVIKIPEENYERLKFMEEMGALNNPYLETIANGTPLPKGHGRLGDLSAVYEDICNDINAMTNLGVMVDGDWLWAKLNDAIDNATTIIEADKESEGEE